MAKILIAIPHYFRREAKSVYDSERSSAEDRAVLVAKTLSGLWTNLGGPTTIYETKGGRLLDGPHRHQINIRLVTAGSDHLVESLQGVRELFRHVSTNIANPRLLGFECHRIFAEEVEDFDWFVYLEDDLVLHDPLLIEKLGWFSQRFGDINLLQVNRYEKGYGYARVYIDGPGRWKAQGRGPPWPETLEAEFLGRTLRFELATNPHSGCFFVTRRQMRRWMRSTIFLDRDTSFVGPLESAATLGIYKTFRVYKTAAANYDFVEIRHAGSVYLKTILARTMLAKKT